MPKKLKRKGRKPLRKEVVEEPRFISFFDRATTVFIENWRLFTVGFVLVGLIVVIVLLWMRNLEQKELQASFLLSQGITKLKEADGLSGEEANKAYDEALGVLEKLVEDYGSADSGELGIFYVGKCLSRLKRFGEAAEEYEKFVSRAGNNQLYRSLALRSLGFAYENEKEYEKALVSYKELADMEGSFLRGESILALAQLFEKMGQKQEALEAYKNFLSEHPDSTQSNLIQKRVAFLEKQLQ